MSIKTGTVEVVNKHYHMADMRLNFYVGRGSILGNPYSHKTGTEAEFITNNREESIESYKTYFYNEFKSNDAFKRYVIDMAKYINMGNDITLQCFCKPKSCHADFIREFVLKLAERIK